jgi:hypothetical protein
MMLVGERFGRRSVEAEALLPHGARGFDLAHRNSRRIARRGCARGRRRRLERAPGQPASEPRARLDVTDASPVRPSPARRCRELVDEDARGHLVEQPRSAIVVPFVVMSASVESDANRPCSDGERVPRTRRAGAKSGHHHRALENGVEADRRADGSSVNARGDHAAITCVTLASSRVAQHRGVEYASRARFRGGSRAPPRRAVASPRKSRHHGFEPARLEDCDGAEHERLEVRRAALGELAERWIRATRRADRDDGWRPAPPQKPSSGLSARSNSVAVEQSGGSTEHSAPACADDLARAGSASLLGPRRRGPARQHFVNRARFSAPRRRCGIVLTEPRHFGGGALPVRAGVAALRSRSAPGSSACGEFPGCARATSLTTGTTTANPTVGDTSGWKNYHRQREASQASATSGPRLASRRHRGSRTPIIVDGRRRLRNRLRNRARGPAVPAAKGEGTERRGGNSGRHHRCEGVPFRRPCSPYVARACRHWDRGAPRRLLRSASHCLSAARVRVLLRPSSSLRSSVADPTRDGAPE